MPPAAASASMSSSSSSSSGGGSSRSNNHHDHHAASPFATTFQLDLPDQHMCVAVVLPEKGDDISSDGLHPLEYDYAMEQMQPARRTFFAGGRVALRRALTLLGAAAAARDPMLINEVGAPILAPGVLGSISHTRGLAVAVAALDGCAAAEDDGAAAAAAASSSSSPPHALGVDVERITRELSPRAATRCLHEAERATLGQIKYVVEGEEGMGDGDDTAALEASDLLLRVSIKEALYKAVHPLIRTSIRWHSVQVYPREDGEVKLVYEDLEQSLGEETKIEATARWQVCEGFFVSTARATLLLSPGGEADAAAKSTSSSAAAADATSRTLLEPLER